MATPRYLPVATFKLWHKDETTLDDTLVEAAINAAETAIDKALQRRMAVSSTSSDRSYAPTPQSQILYIHDATAVTSVVENGRTLTANVDYQLEPLNAIDATGEAWPYYVIRRLDNWWYTRGQRATVVVTGAWGWASIPPMVVEACKIVTGDMLSNRDMRNGLVAITEAGGVGSRENRTVRDMVANYRYPSSLLVA